MRTNGFILIALSLTAGAWAGTSGYLPGVGPVALRFEREMSYRVALPIPAAESGSHPHTVPVAREDFTAELPVEPPTNPPTVPLLQDTPIPTAEPAAVAPTDPNQPLVSPLMETNGVVTPQMFLRFFTPPRVGVSSEAVIAVPPGFNPAPPPTPPSTATYTQSKP